MKSAPRAWLTALLAALVMAVVLIGTSNALKDAGPWAEARLGRHHPSADPYEGIDRLIAAAARDVLPSTIRDPFGYGTAAPAPGLAHRAARPKPKVVETPQPMLTAVVTGGDDPRAIIDYDGHTYSVHVGSMFAEYRVVSIAETSVVIESNGKQSTLYLGPKGK
jgi:hypothetical protein